MRTRLGTAAAALALAMTSAAGISTLMASPASAECTGGRWPSFTRYAPTARDVVVGTVTWSALPGAHATWFTLTVDETLRGGMASGDSIGFDRLHSGAPEPSCPDGSVMLVRPGDRLAVALDARYPGQLRRITTAASVLPSDPDDLSVGIQHLSEARVRRIVGIPAPVVPTPIPGATASPAPSATPPVAYPVGIDCRGLYGETAVADMSAAAFARLCDPARAPVSLQPVLDYAQAQPGYAGALFTNGAHPSAAIWFTDDLERHTAEIAALTPADATVAIQSTTWAWTRLHAVQDQITRGLRGLLASDIPITTVRIDVRRNLVVVGLERTTDRVADMLQERYGERVVTSVMSRRTLRAERLSRLPNTDDLPVTVTGPSSLMRGVRAATLHDVKQGPDPDGGNVWTSRLGARRLLVEWVGGACDVHATVTLERRSRVSVRVTDAPGCDDVGVGRGVVISTSRVLPANVSATIAFDRP